jgi:hypothetical protein
MKVIDVAPSRVSAAISAAKPGSEAGRGRRRDDAAEGLEVDVVGLGRGFGGHRTLL